MHNQNSITRKRRGITVAPSPFNKVKFELGIILLLLPLAWLVVERLVGETIVEFMLLFAMACLAAAWLIWRTRSVLRQMEREREDGAQQE